MSERFDLTNPQPGGVDIPFPNFTGRSVFEYVASVVPVLESKDGIVSGRGSAFLVSDLGILLTAGHVVNGAFSADVEAGDYLGDSGHFFFILVPRGDKPEDSGQLTGVTIRQIVFEQRLSDIALLKIEMDDIPPATSGHTTPWPIAHFQPDLDENCVITGYADMKPEVFVDENGVSVPGEWTHRLSSEEGKVLTVYPSGRDNLLSPFPCFDVDIATTGGMSGGPAFIERGLVGVLSRGWTGFDENGTALMQSSVALMSSCYQLGMDLDMGAGIRTYSVAGLIRMGHINAIGPSTWMTVIDNGPDDERFKVEWA